MDREKVIQALLSGDIRELHKCIKHYYTYPGAVFYFDGSASKYPVADTNNEMINLNSIVVFDHIDNDEDMVKALLEKSTLDFMASWITPKFWETLEHQEKQRTLTGGGR